ncbi:MAG: DUF1186 domain-containing protein [Magnetococcales bacterium]|nr:DUF1186 domain-containing protein [Magnetococcales bacterium]
MMTRDHILDALGADTFPAETLAVFRSDREVGAAILLDILESAVNDMATVAEDELTRSQRATFMVVHLLAEFGDQRSFPLLARLLHGDAELVEDMLGDAITETLPGILVSTFDGNVALLHQLIRDDSVYEYVRSSALDALAYLTAKEMVPLEFTEPFLRDCFDRFQNEKLNFVWVGWVESISDLGLESFVPLVEQAFNEGAIDPSIMNFYDFYDSLRNIIDGEPEALKTRFSRIPFTNCNDLTKWAWFRSEGDSGKRAGAPGGQQPNNPKQQVNPFRNIGRNDPCPCGSGRKYKKCCLN